MGTQISQFHINKDLRYTLRRKTTTGRDLTTNTVEIINKWLYECENKFMDGTATYFDHPIKLFLYKKRIKACNSYW
jgi:hypothetical protein